MLFIYLLLFLNLFFLSYEIVIFNEEFFIAFMFFSFFFITYPIIGNLLKSSYTEDKNRIFSYFIDDIFHQYSFLNNFLLYLSLYESNKEFLFQYLSFLADGLFNKFISFYEGLLLNKGLSLYQRLPESFFLFYERLLNFIFLKFQVKFMDYFVKKWDNLILNEILINLNNNVFGNSLKNSENTNWVYGGFFISCFIFFYNNE